MSVSNKAAGTIYVGNVGNPSDAVASFFRERDFKYLRMGPESVTGTYEGPWGDYTIVTNWCTQNRYMAIRIDFMPVEGSLKEDLSFLTLSLNDAQRTGAFCVTRGTQSCYFRDGFYQHDLDSAYDMVTKFICHAIGTVDQYYPAFQAVLVGKLNCDEAVALAGLTPLGQA